MRMKNLVLTTFMLVFGGSMAWAGSGENALYNSGAGEAVSVHTIGSEDPAAKEKKLGLLESKIEELEAKINRFFPGSSPQAEGYNLGNVPYDSETIRSMEGWNSKDHLMEAKVNQQTSESLETKIQKIQDRIDRFSQKPYLDPKGFKRSGLEILKGKLMQDRREAEIKTAWHRAQVEKSLLSESQIQKNS